MLPFTTNFFTMFLWPQCSHLQFTLIQTYQPLPITNQLGFQVLGLATTCIIKTFWTFKNSKKHRKSRKFWAAITICTLQGISCHYLMLTYSQRTNVQLTVVCNRRDNFGEKKLKSQMRQTSRLNPRYDFDRSCVSKCH
jgi:hypothetical protein